MSCLARHLLCAASFVALVSTNAGATTLFGVLGFYAIGSSLDNAVAYALPLAGGVTLYVAASDLIPAAHGHAGKFSAVLFCVGVGFLWLTAQILEQGHAH